MHLKPESGLLVAGWSRLRQSHKVLWWVYVVNLVLALFSAIGLSLRLSRVLDHSAAAARLVNGMDLGYLIELAAHPDVQPAIAFNSSLAAAALFFLFMLFALGGILQSYARGRHLVPGEFFQAAGSFFWRFVRLLLWTFVFLIPGGILLALFGAVIGRATANSSHASLEFWLRLAAYAVVWILLTIVRLCFDIAQVKTVGEDRRDMTRVLGASIRLTLRNLGTLFPIYFGLSLLGWAGTALVFWCWLKAVPADNTLAMFLLGQFIALLWITTRLWQRACEVVWFQRYQSLQLPLALLTNDETDAANAIQADGVLSEADAMPPTVSASESQTALDEAPATLPQYAPPEPPAN